MSRIQVDPAMPRNSFRRMRKRIVQTPWHACGLSLVSRFASPYLSTCHMSRGRRLTKSLTTKMPRTRKHLRFYPLSGHWEGFQAVRWQSRLFRRIQFLLVSRSISAIMRIARCWMLPGEEGGRDILHSSCVIFGMIYGHDLRNPYLVELTRLVHYAIRWTFCCEWRC
jgi:hypothetical protein